MEPGKLFIGGISWDTNETRLRDYFQAFGEVVEAVIMKDRATGRARGFGFVVFADPAVAKRVLMEKHLIDGRNVEAKKAIPREDKNILNRDNSSIHGSPGPVHTKKIFVGGLASTVTESDFKQYFDQFGAITDVVVMYDYYTQRPRGFGFITYDSEEAVDRVLHKIFHELNGKLVEVKRAVPKELSPGPTRNLLGGYNYSPSRVSNFLNGYPQGYSSSSTGGYVARMDGRFNPATIGCNNSSPMSAGYGMDLNFDQNLSPSYGENLSLSSHLGYGQLSPSYSGSSSRYGSSIGYGGGQGGSNSILKQSAQSLLGNESINHTSDYMNFSALMATGRGSSGMGSFGGIEALWDSSVKFGRSIAGATYSNGSFSNGSGDFNVGLGAVGYGRSSEISVAPVTSLVTSKGDYDRAYAEIYGNGSLYGDLTWQSSSLELRHPSSFGKAASDIITKRSARYVGGYSVANRQPDSGIAA
uniref:RRM domain-containing protein n=1 Tax=Rhizophora mucronata TaxID=61149 RepID=A0A2P2JAR7_RHIMU